MVKKATAHGPVQQGRNESKEIQPDPEDLMVRKPCGFQLCGGANSKESKRNIS